MGKIIVVGEHRIEIPDPKSKSDILFINEKKEDAFWDRSRLIKEYRDIWTDFIPNHTKLYQQATIHDQDNILIALNKEDSDYIVRIYQQEIYRRRYGVHINNGGEITWLTGDHYNALMWCKGQRHDGLGDYFDYREFQAWFFYLIHHCWSFAYILGLIMSKPKKTGITNLFWLYYLNRATMSKNRNYGYMNIEQGQAAKTFRDYFLYSYNSMIPALRPQWKNKSEVEGSIIFGKQYNNSKKAKLIAYDSEDELNSSVFCVPTKDKAFDVAVMTDIAFDEPTKYKQSFGEIFRSNKDAVKIQSKINGRAWAFNYTIGNDTDSFKETRDIFLDSKIKTITANSGNQTKSGMIAWHLPAYASWEGCFDKYGRCDEKRALKEIEQERDKVKDNRRNLQTVIRQYANDEREAWASAGAGSTFDNIRLGDLLADLEIDQRDATENPYKEGRLEWKNPLWEVGLKNKRPNGEFGNGVKFIELTDEEKELGETGRIRRYHYMPESYENMALKYGRDEYGFLIPPDRFINVCGADPTNYAAGSEVTQGSKNAYYVMPMPDEKYDRAMGKVSTKVFSWEYFYRPELPNESYEDFIKLIIFTGALALVEGNAPYVATRMMQEGLGHYMIVRNKEGLLTIWKPFMGLPASSEKTYKLVRMVSNSAINKEMMETLVRLYKNYIEKPASGEKDYGKTVKSERLLNQLMNVDVLDTRIYDLFMAGGYCLWAVEIYLDYLLHANDDYNDESIGSVLYAIAQD